MDGMDAFGGLVGNYGDRLAERAKASKVYAGFQMIGLELANILSDRAHTPLYIKLAKTHPDHAQLMILAKDIAGKPSVTNKGAYFMKALSNKDKGYDGWKKDTPRNQ